MGLLRRLLGLRRRSRHATIVLLGLDNAGKSSMLARLGGDDVTRVTPTQGFCIKTLVVNNVRLSVWDVGGQRAVRFYWRQYFHDAEALIFVIDAADEARLGEAMEQFAQLMEEDKLAGVPLLVLANKQDLLGALTPDDVATALRLDELRGRCWRMQGCSAAMGDGLQEGLAWVVDQVQQQQQQQQPPPPPPRQQQQHPQSQSPPQHKRADGA